jgi:6-pyruvoyl-tetrahydropterin synthase related domain
MLEALAAHWKRATLLSREPVVFLVAIAALAGLAIVPVFLYGPPMVVDGPLHYFRLVELNWHLQHGDYYPRWFNDIYHGYGGPVLTFYPPLSYYITLLLHLIGLNLPDAFNASFALAMTVGVTGMALWVRSHTASSVAGLVAAAVYGLSPYYYYNVYIRGALPETWGLALAPWLLWALHRFITLPSPRAYRGYVLLYAAAVFTHNLTALLMTPVYLIYGAGRLWQVKASRKQWAVFGLAFLHAAGVAALYLVPFVVELGWVGLGRAALNYQDFYVPLADLFSLPVAFDPYLIRNPFPLSIPLVALAGAVLGTAFIFRSGSRDRWLTAAMLGLALLYSLMTVELSEPIWQILPISTLIQFPWRLLGPIMLILAWLCGLAAARINNNAAAWGFVAASLLFGLTWSYRYPTTGSYPASGVPADVIQYEINVPGALGLTFQQEFLPKWVGELPPSDLMLDQSGLYNSQYRLQTPPAGVTILRQEASLTSALVEYEAADDFVATFHIFYYPGWSAKLDGQDIVLQPSVPKGLIEIKALAGHHTLQIERHSTPDHIVGLSGSLIALLIFLFIRFKPPTAPPSEKAPAPLWPYILLFVGLLVLRASVLEWAENPFKHTRLYQSIDPSMPNVQFGNELRLLRAIVPAHPQPADQPIETTLYWQAIANVTIDYHISLQLVDGNGSRFGQSDQYPGLIPTGGLKQDQYGPDTHSLMPLAGTPPGDYKVLATVYELREGGVHPLPLIVNGGEAGIEYELMRITLTTGWLDGGDDFYIEEAAVAGETFGVGDAVGFTMLWHTGPVPPPGLRTRFAVVDNSGREAFATEFLPAGEAYPSEQWVAAQLIRYPHTIILPPDLPAGPAQFVLAFVDAQGRVVGEPFELGQFNITVPERTVDIPSMGHTDSHLFNDAIEFLGYDQNGETLTLYWKSLTTVSFPLTVYVHYFASDGTLINGADSPPARPVTSWLPGEVVTDIRPLLLGDYFEIGLYNSQTGEPFGTPYTVRP